jgi:hypothetical protein
LKEKKENKGDFFMKAKLLVFTAIMVGAVACGHQKRTDATPTPLDARFVDASQGTNVGNNATLELDIKALNAHDLPKASYRMRVVGFSRDFLNMEGKNNPATEADDVAFMELGEMQSFVNKKTNTPVEILGIGKKMLIPMDWVNTILKNHGLNDVSSVSGLSIELEMDPDGILGSDANQQVGKFIVYFPPHLVRKDFNVSPVLTTNMENLVISDARDGKNNQPRLQFSLRVRDGRVNLPEAANTTKSIHVKYVDAKNDPKAAFDYYLVKGSQANWKKTKDAFDYYIVEGTKANTATVKDFCGKYIVDGTKANYEKTKDFCNYFFVDGTKENLKKLDESTKPAQKWLVEGTEANLDWLGDKTEIAKDWLVEGTIANKDWLVEGTKANAEWLAEGTKANYEKSAKWLSEGTEANKKWLVEGTKANVEKTKGLVDYYILKGTEANIERIRSLLND